FPAGRAVIYAGFAGFLDQNWRVETTDTLTLAGEQVPVVDIASSSGGVARLRVGSTYAPKEGLGISFGLDLFTGKVERIQGRVFGTETSTPACCRSAWNYEGLGYSGGVHWAP